MKCEDCNRKNRIITSLAILLIVTVSGIATTIITQTYVINNYQDYGEYVNTLQEDYRESINRILSDLPPIKNCIIKESCERQEIETCRAEYYIYGAEKMEKYQCNWESGEWIQRIDYPNKKTNIWCESQTGMCKEINPFPKNLKELIKIIKGDGKK